MPEIDGVYLIYPGQWSGVAKGVDFYTRLSGYPFTQVHVNDRMFWEIRADAQSYCKHNLPNLHFMTYYLFEVDEQGTVVGYKRKIDDEGTELISYLEML